MSEKTQFGSDLIQAMSEALAHASGQGIETVRVNHIDIGTVDAKAVRGKLELTQDEMAVVLGVSASGYRKWEQGKRQPSGAARTLLKIMDREPAAVMRALTADRRG